MRQLRRLPPRSDGSTVMLPPSCSARARRLRRPLERVASPGPTPLSTTVMHISESTATSTEVELAWAWRARIALAKQPIVEPGYILLHRLRSEEHTSELQSLMRISYAVFCLKK